jgi:hypothetical protein
MILYFRMAPEGRALIDARPGLARWWARMSARPSMATTRSPME